MKTLVVTTKISLYRADEYFLTFAKEVMPRYESAEGMISSLWLEYRSEGTVEFKMISCWESSEALSRFVLSLPFQPVVDSLGGSVRIWHQIFEVLHVNGIMELAARLEV